MEILQQHLKSIKIPTEHDKVYKDECVYSFDNPVGRDPPKINGYKFIMHYAENLQPTNIDNIIHFWLKLDLKRISTFFQETDTGLYVSLSSFLGLGKDHLERHFRKTGESVYLHLRRERREVITNILSAT